MTMSLPPKSLVLYTDDDADDLALMREAFSEFAHTIDLLTFNDGFELLHFLTCQLPPQTEPCLIILDINMPRVNGMEVLKKLRTKTGTKDVPVVLFSTSTLPSEAAFARKLNAGFITKPLTSTQIHKIVEQLLGHCKEEVRKRINRK